MNITCKDKVFKIDTENTSYVIAVADEEGFIGHAYYGDRIEEAPGYLLRTEENPFVPSKNNRDRGSFMDSFPCEYPGNGLGDYRDGAVEIIDADGHRAINLTFDDYKIVDGKPHLKGLPQTFEKGTGAPLNSGEGKGGENREKTTGAAKTLEIYASDKVLGVKAILRYSVFDDNDAIVRSAELINDSKETVYITKALSASIDMDSEDYELLTLHGSWARERQIDIRPIGYGKTSVGSVKGESSHQEHPFMALVQKGTTQDYGKVYGFSFVYSGNFLAQVEKSQFDSVRAMMGINPGGFKWELKAGESFQTPEVVMVYSGEGLGRMSRTYHDLYREHLIRSPYKDKERPILINNWEATYFDFNTEKLLSIAREAKKSGIEMLVMDDGWFGVRNDDNTSLGDWNVNEEKLPGGLKYLVDEVNKIGLKFGIWMEPEMISPDSELYRAHPDWAIQIPGRVATRSRNQYVLDLTRPEVLEHTWNSIKTVLGSANIEYLKWDMNRQITDIGSVYLGRENQGELSHRFTLAVYELQERLVREFPNLLLENCSGGGARFDPGMLYFSPQIWCSDDTDAIERLGIQEGTSLVYPLSSMGAHVSDCPNHTVGRVTPFVTRGHVALAGTFGYELDITKIPENDRAMIPEQTATYHKYNRLVREGDYYRVASFRENHFFDCYGVVGKDKKEALFTFVQVFNRPNCHSRLIRLKGLDSGKNYSISFIHGAGEGSGEKREVLSGDTIMKAGILMQNPWGDFVSCLIYLREV
ncbi:MAG: alpha-galactosidase [Lachnospiraceae bacterium]|nr:alpha-galactosidase [Lachnospiraceae bacterium]